MQQPQHHLIYGQQVAPVRVNAAVVFEAGASSVPDTSRRTHARRSATASARLRGSDTARWRGSRSAQRFRRLKIQRSSSGTTRLSDRLPEDSSSARAEATAPRRTLSIFMKISREAFQILFAKARALSIVLAPMDDIGTRSGAAASVPYGPRRFRISPSPPADR